MFKIQFFLIVMVDYSMILLLQGPKLNFLGRCQLATEMFFFSVAIWKNVVAKKCHKSFPSQRNTNQNFWWPDGKIGRMPAIYAVSCDCQMFQVNFVPSLVSTFWRRNVAD